LGGAHVVDVVGPASTFAVVGTGAAALRGLELEQAVTAPAAPTSPAASTRRRDTVPPMNARVVPW